MYTSSQLIQSLVNSVEVVDYEPLAKEYNVTEWDIESACMCIQQNLEETLKSYPEFNQDFIKESSALSNFLSYIPEHLANQ